MNNEESRFRDLLNQPPFDGSYHKDRREQVRQQVLEAFDASQADLSRHRVRRAFPNWREIMSRPVPRFAAIVLALVTACVVFSVLFRTQSTIAFDNIVEPILKAKTARFNAVIEAKNLPKQTVRTLVLEPNRLRQEMPAGRINIFDSNVGRMMTLTPAEKSAMVFKIIDMPSQQTPVNFFDRLRTSLSATDDDAASKREPLGRKQIAGREAIGFRVKQLHGEMTIWGDAKTGLPILVEMTLDTLPDAKVTMTDFEFDIALDEALFNTEPPEGYSVQRLDITTPGEKDLIGAFRLLTDDNGGRFPDTFGHKAIDAFMEKNLGPPEELTKKVMPLSQGLVFAAMLPAESNARYAGKGIKRGDATSPVFWYKQVGSSKCRVIYGDLSIKEQNSAPESPNALPVTLAVPLAAREPDEPAARQVIDQMAKVYAGCKSYRDSGVVTTVTAMDSGDRTVEEKSFTTAFMRPNRFRFDVTSRLGDRQNHYLVWSNGKGVQIFRDVKWQIERAQSLGVALGGATAATGGSAPAVPALLLSEMWGNITHMSGARLAEDGMVDKVACFRLEGKQGKHPITVWIEKSSYLIRRIHEQMKLDKLTVEFTTTYEPFINEEVSDKLLEFDPPVEN